MLLLSDGEIVNNKETDGRLTSCEHCLFNGYNMIPVTRNITIIKSAWWLLMAWRLFDARASATIAMAYVARSVCIRVPNVMTCQSGVCSVVSRLFYACSCTTYSSPVLANHVRAKVCGPWNRLNSSPTGKNGRYFTNTYAKAWSWMNSQGQGWVSDSLKLVYVHIIS